MLRERRIGPPHDLAMWLALLDADFDASHDLELARELRRLGERLVRAAG